MDNLLPCAHCGSQDIGGSFQDNMYCYQCGASAPGITAWNTRHTPEGWQLVPTEANPEMMKQGFIETQYDEGRGNRMEVYRAMLAAAPKWGGE